MLLTVSAILPFVFLTGCAGLAVSANSSGITYVCDEELTVNVMMKLQLLQTTTDNLRLKMENLDIAVNKGFQSLKENKTVVTDTKVNLKSQPSAGDFKPADIGADSLLSLEGFFKKHSESNHAVSNRSASSTSYIPTSCAEAVRLSGLPQGIHKIRIPGSHLKPFFVYCMADPKEDGGAWTLVQRRIDGSIDFERPWKDYVRGFGNLEQEFFIGLEKLHELTHSSVHELWIQLEDFENGKRWAKYSSFAIGDASESYALNVLGSFTGDAGDSLKLHAGQKFTTKDVDNDSRANSNCAVDFTGAWWYQNCHHSNLNGKYLRGSYPADKYGKGIDWYTWRDHNYSMKYVHMAIRSLG